eukprot:6205066-Pleurochrysis_carterae.AAC.4
MLSPKKFANKGMAEFLEFKGNLKEMLHFHKHKLHTILFDDKLPAAVQRQHAKELDDEKVVAADKEARMKEFIEACNEDAFVILMINTADTTLKNRLRHDYDDDAHGAWMYIEHLHKVKDNGTRSTKASYERKALVEEGMASGTEAAAHTMVEKLLELKTPNTKGLHTTGAITCCPRPSWTPWPRTCPTSFACTRPARSTRASGATA